MNSTPDAPSNDLADEQDAADGPELSNPDASRVEDGDADHETIDDAEA